MVLVAATRISEIFLYWNEWLPAEIYRPIYDLVRIIGIPLSSGATGLETYIATTNNLISIMMILVFTALYSTTGGLRSVIATDTVQFSLAMIGTIIYAIVVMSKSGGLGQMVQQLKILYGSVQAEQILSFSPQKMEALGPFLVIIGLQWFFERNSDGTGYFAQRMMACRSDRDAEVGAFVFAWLQILLRSLVWLVIGVGLLVLYPYSPGAPVTEQFVAGREILFASGIRDLLPPVVKGMVLTGLLAALASTIDTHLTWGASYWSNDLYKRIINEAWLNRKPPDKELVGIARLSNVIILVIALIIMSNLGSIQTAWYITLLFGAGTGAVLVLRWLWERVNLYSEISAIVVSLIAAPIILIATEQEWLRLLSMSVISTVCVIIVTLSTKPVSEKVLSRFYRKVEPPGFWKNTAARSKLDASRPMRTLRNGIYLTITVSLSLYLLLIGFGRLLFPPPDGHVSVTVIYIVSGLLSIFLWWRKVFKK
jgi:SSS family solute:Na+ symporter